MRKKINYQRSEYMKDGELICFGVSEHVLKEYFPTFSEKARKQILAVKNMFETQSIEEAIPRPAHDSKFDDTKTSLRAKLRLFIAIGLL
jgi:hypothetical protein